MPQPARVAEAPALRDHVLDVPARPDVAFRVPCRTVQPVVTAHEQERIIELQDSLRGALGFALGRHPVTLPSISSRSILAGSSFVVRISKLPTVRRLA